MPIRNHRWGVCVLLFFATTLNYLDRQTLSILAPAISDEIGLDNNSLGLLFAIFYYSYTVGQFAIGGLLDRWNLRWAYAFGVLAWSLVAALTAISTAFLSLLIFRLLLGLTESMNWPAAMRVVARSMAPSERSLGNGIFTSGTSVGALIAPAIVLALSAWIGWRWAFVAVGALGGVWFVVWLRFTRGAGYAQVWRAEDSRSPLQNSYSAVIRAPQFWPVFAVAVLVNPCLYFLLNWLPTYFTQHHATDAKSLASILTLVYLGLDAGYLACGAGVLVLMRIGWTLSRARRGVFYAASALLALACLAPYAPGIEWAVGLFAAANLGAGCWIAMYLTMAQEVSHTHVSTAAGLLGGAGSLAGAFAMWGVGAVSHATESFDAPLFGLATAAGFAAIAGTVVVRRSEEAR
jgi:MFS transporter, ACS family, hexuronate transporter